MITDALPIWIGCAAHRATPSSTQIVKALAARGTPRGMVVVITDVMAPEGWEDGFRHLGAMGHEVRVIRVGCAEDLAPTFSGELELHDAETGERVRLRVNKALLERYGAEVKKHLEAARESCQRAGGRWIEVDVEMPMDAIVKRCFGGPVHRTAAGSDR